MKAELSKSCAGDALLEQSGVKVTTSWPSAHKYAPGTLERINRFFSIGRWVEVSNMLKNFSLTRIVCEAFIYGGNCQSSATEYLFHHEFNTEIAILCMTALVNVTRTYWSPSNDYLGCHRCEHLDFREHQPAALRSDFPTAEPDIPGVCS